MKKKVKKIKKKMLTLLKTERSFLTTQPLPDVSLLQTCVSECQGKLIEIPEIVVFGKVAHQHRNIGFFSNTSVGYEYSNRMAPSQPLTVSLEKLLAVTNELYQASFNGILVNEYTDGTDYIGAHSDEEKNLDPVGVVSVSFGAIRTFRIRDKKENKIVLDVPMEPGVYLHMGGSFQKEFKHEIPQQKKVQGVRYSFTFRRHLK